MTGILAEPADIRVGGIVRVRVALDEAPLPLEVQEFRQHGMPFAIPGIEVGDGDTVAGVFDLRAGRIQPRMPGVLVPAPVKGRGEGKAPVGGIRPGAGVFGGGGAKCLFGKPLRCIEHPLLLEVRLREFDVRASRDAEALGLQLMAQIPRISLVHIGGDVGQMPFGARLRAFRRSGREWLHLEWDFSDSKAGAFGYRLRLHQEPWPACHHERVPPITPGFARIRTDSP